MKMSRNQQDSNQRTDEGTRNEEPSNESVESKKPDKKHTHKQTNKTNEIKEKTNQWHLLDFGAGALAAEASEERRLAAAFGLIGFDLAAGRASRVASVRQPVVVAPARQPTLGQLPPPPARLDRRLIQRSGPQRHSVSFRQDQLQHLPFQTKIHNRQVSTSLFKLASMASNRYFNRVYRDAIEWDWRLMGN